MHFIFVTFLTCSRKSIFIFLSNTGAKLINQISLRLWQEGKQREDIQLKDFEKSIREGSFNEEGNSSSTSFSSSIFMFTRLCIICH